MTALSLATPLILPNPLIPLMNPNLHSFTPSSAYHTILPTIFVPLALPTNPNVGTLMPNSVRFGIPQPLTSQSSDHLIPRELSVAPYDDTPSVVHTEGEFDGIPICLKLDPLKSADLEPFQRGTVVSYKGSNSEVGKYMVKCCQLVRENIAL